jgi:hypothetical protein
MRQYHGAQQQRADTRNDAKNYVETGILSEKRAATANVTLIPQMESHGLYYSLLLTLRGFVAIYRVKADDCFQQKGSTA